MEEMHPRRFVGLESARLAFGPAVDRLGALMRLGDPLADAAVAVLAARPDRGQGLVERALAQGIDATPEAPPELVALFAELDHVPAWLDKEALARGGELLLRAGWFGGLALATSLLYGYASPGGNKPLVFSGQLAKLAPRRLIETSRFVEATCAPNSLTRFAPGFAITVKVRLMHAHVRRMILASGRWDVEAWGLPANQHDMGATSLLFSIVAVDSLAKLGFTHDEDEVHRFMQLWRYSGHLMGVHPEVLPASAREARRLAEIIAMTEEPPDDDSRALSRALFATGESPVRATPAEIARAKRMVYLGQGIIRGMLGDALADQLDVPHHTGRFAFPVLRALIGSVERRADALPAPLRAAWRRRAIAAGQAYWSGLTRAAEADSPARTPLDFAPPEALLGLADAVLRPSAPRGATLASVARPR